MCECLLAAYSLYQQQVWNSCCPRTTLTSIAGAPSRNTLTSIAGTPSNNLRELVLPETQKTSSKPTDKNSRGYHSSSVSRWSCLVLLKQFREIFLISEIISSLPFIRLIIVCDSGRRGSSACLSSGSLVISMNPHRGENVPKFTSPPNLNQPKMGAGKCSGK